MYILQQTWQILLNVELGPFYALADMAEPTVDPHQATGVQQLQQQQQQLQQHQQLLQQQQQRGSRKRRMDWDQLELNPTQNVHGPNQDGPDGILEHMTNGLKDHRRSAKNGGSTSSSTGKNLYLN